MTYTGFLETHDHIAAPAGLRPPPEHAEKATHWIEDDQRRKWVWEWTLGKWFIPGVTSLMLPNSSAVAECRYLGPAAYVPHAPAMAAPPFSGTAGAAMREVARLRAENAGLRKPTNVEAVAEAIWRDRYPDEDWAYAKWLATETPEGGNGRYLTIMGHAQAAIAAMNEYAHSPTPTTPWTGLPPDPTVDGPHWLRDARNPEAAPYLAYWSADARRWFGWFSSTGDSPEHTASVARYVGPAIPPEVRRND